MRFQRLLALSAFSLVVIGTVADAQNTQGPLPQPGPMTTTPGPLQPGGTADTTTRSRLSRIGSVIGIDGGLFVLTALGLVAITRNTDSTTAPSTTNPTTSTSST